MNKIDLYSPQHFTKKQSEWIKKYCIVRNKAAYEQGKAAREEELRQVIDQIKWERDIAIQQLHDLGYAFGEKIKEKKNG